MTQPAPVRIDDWSPRAASARARLLSAAREELIETGELEVASAARRAGVSVGLPYRYFGSRAGLLVAVVEDFFDRLGVISLHKYEGATFAAREYQRIRDWVLFLYAEPLSGVVLNGITGDAEVGTATMAHARRLAVLGGHNVAQAQAAGELPTERDPEMLAAASIGGTHAVVMIALARQPRPGAEVVIAETWAFVAGAVGIGAHAAQRGSTT